jgi:Carboxypeptidase regulatory-like domain/TonB dependent receptor
MRFSFGWILVGLLIASLFVIASTSYGQTSSATISGQITDQSGKVVIGVSVVLTNINTNLPFTTTTNKDGIYNLSALPPGIYRANVTKDGFKGIVKGDIELHTQDSVSLNFALQVGSVSETVTVSANAEHMATDNPAVGVLVNREFVENIPLNGRSFQDLIALAPGAISSANNPGTFSINGQRDDANYYSVDGVGAPTNPSLTTIAAGLSGAAPGQTALGTTQNLVSVDALEEFRIQTSSYSAEYGRQPGGQVEFRTRSGQNDFHGSLFDYFRNEAMDANDWFSNHDGLPRGVDRQNDFGGTFGGPIRIPHVYNGKDKTFFFFSYEGLRLKTPFFDQENVPTVAVRQGAAASVQPFLNAYPVPNGVMNNDGVTAQFVQNISQPSTFDATAIRVDHYFNRKFQVFGRFSDTPSSSSSYAGAAEFAVGPVNTRTFTLGSTLVLGSSLSDEARFNYTTIHTSAAAQNTNLGGAVPLPKSLLIPAEYQSVGAGTVFLALPGMAGGLSDYTVGGAQFTSQAQFNAVNTVAWTIGLHAVKFGVDWRRLAPTFGLQPYGDIIEFTSLSDIQQGFASVQLASASQIAKPVFDNLSVFGQDHWKLTSRLTLDLGLRWEFNPVPGASNGKYPLAVTQTTNLATMELAPEGTPVYQTGYDHFAPRLGFAYEIIPSTNHATVIRGGGGIFYDVGQNLAAVGYAGYPFYQRGSINFSVPLPLQSSYLVPPSLNVPLTPPYGSLSGIMDPRITLPYTDQWSLSLDQQLSNRNTLTVSYVGNVGHKLLFSEDYSNIAAINPNFTNVQITSNAAASSYNALQVQDQGYVAPGLQVVASYVWAHARDSASTEGVLGFPPTWGNSDNDIRQILNLATNYKIPTKQGGARFLQFVTNGWLVSNRFEALSGYPFTVYQGSYCPPTGPACASFTPNLVVGQPIYLHNVPSSPGGWQLNPNAFSPVPTDPNTGAPLALGTLGRNFLHGPGFWNLNTPVERIFSLHERLSLAFRVDAFNIFNHPNFASVDSFLGDATFGQPTLTSEINGTRYATGTSRILQLSLKFRF